MSKVVQKQGRPRDRKKAVGKPEEFADLIDELVANQNVFSLRAYFLGSILELKLTLKLLRTQIGKVDAPALADVLNSWLKEYGNTSQNPRVANWLNAHFKRSKSVRDDWQDGWLRDRIAELKDYLAGSRKREARRAKRTAKARPAVSSSVRLS
jgi:hypothetical protein